MEHFVIARHWKIDPAAVLEWDEEMVRDAVQIMAAEARYHDREKRRSG